MFQASYSSDGWIGDVKAYEIDTTPGSPTYGQVITTSYVWSASEKLEELNWNTDRLIVTYNGSNAGIPFRADSLTDTQKAQLDTNWEASGAVNITNYLRGDTTNEEDNGGSYRNRYQTLGDIIHSSPLHKNGVLYVGGNDGMLHAIAADDDDEVVVEGGEELFAYVPNLVFENLNELADPDYSHKFFVDLTPAAADVTLSGVSTILVGGLGKGGKGYYALDISDVSNESLPFSTESELAAKVMWEYPNSGTPTTEVDDLGFSYSRPIIVRSNDSTNAEWVVIFGNGYNSQNGNAVLVILNASDGALIKSIDTGVSSCNGLSTPVAIDYNFDEKVDYVYAGDLKGNLWKFDLTDSDYNNWDSAYLESGPTPQPLFTAKGPGGTVQPITTKPDVMSHCEKDGYMVIFGTGKYLGESDFSDTSTQTIYGIWDYGDDSDDDEYIGSFDRGSTPELSNQPDWATGESLTLLQQNIVPSTEADTNFWTVGSQRLRILTNNIDDIENPWETTSLDESEVTCGDGAGVIDCDPDSVGSYPDPVKYLGWYFDLPISGERVVSDLMIRDGKVVVISYIPEQSPCGSGGESVVMEMDACSGGRLSEAQLDINEDGVIDDNDLVNIGTDDDPIYVPPTGIEAPGRLLPPAILGLDDDEEMKYFSSSRGNIESVVEEAVKQGIVHWIEH
jgi:type IV pilus assembly protein PilY1